MRTIVRVFIGLKVLGLIGFGALYWPVSGYGAIPQGMSSARIDVAVRGRELTNAAGCLGCHWNAKEGEAPFAGGLAIETPIGTLYSTNITPDPETGIGAYSDDDFVAALKHGRRRDGQNLLPAFPYTSYARMPVEDMLAIKAYLFSAVKPVHQENKPHDTFVPAFLMRGPVTLWKFAFFDPQEFEPDPAFNARHNRGRYLVEVLGHCGECHTPRDVFLVSDAKRFLAGTASGADGRKVPNITPDPDTGIGAWTVPEMSEFLRTGVKPDLDNVQGAMREVIEYNTKNLSDDDLTAMVAYLRDVPPMKSEPPAR